MTIYRLLEEGLETKRINGRECMKKSICEAAMMSLQDEGLVGELLHLLLTHGFNGRSCLLKNVCQTLQYAKQQDGVIGKILKLFARSYIDNDTWHEDPLFCERHSKNCPLELIGFNSFTES
ncbi:hypothetical protein EAG_06419 [Camponotus floridanus]|uniref:Uncharacterized protein n=1 Tax=Camponotus floridanus TaxID=104421 RepID=E1ZY78_CAMFO|nr:hypothetical protein EAG_06419 [Camponotus floridanus]